MKKHLLLFVIAFFAITVQAQKVQITKAREQNSKRKPISNVKVYFEGAIAAVSESDGRVRLVFLNKKAGEWTFKEDILCTGYELVNEKELEKIRLSNDDQLGVDIILARAGVVDSLKAIHYGVSNKSLKASFEREKTKLRKERDAARLSKQQFEEQFTQLREQYDNQKGNLDALAEKFARINLDDATPVYQEAFVYFQQGDLEKAMQILNGADLHGQVAKMKEKETKAYTKAKESEQDLLDVKEKKPQLLQTLMFKADLHKLTYQIDSARMLFLDMLDLDRTNFQLQYDYAAFLQINAKVDESIIAYNAAFKKAKSNSDSILTMLSIANIYSGFSQIKEAKPYFIKALNLENKLNIANTLNIYKSIAGMYRKTFQYDSCDYYYTKALELARMNIDDKKFRKYKARVYDEIGQYYASRLLYQNSKQYYDTADYTYKVILTKYTLDTIYKKEILRDYASFLDNRGNEYIERKRIKESELYFIQSDSILNVLVKQKDIAALNMLFTIIPSRMMSYVQFGDTSKVNQLRLKIASLPNQPNGEFRNITNSLLNMATKINQLFKEGFVNNEQNTLIDTTLDKHFNIETFTALEKLLLNMKNLLTEKDTLEREMELDKYYAYYADSLNFENFVNKGEFCTVLLSIGNEYYGIGNSDKGLESHVKAYEYAEQLSNRDKLGYSFLPQRYLILNTIGQRAFEEDNYQSLEICFNNLSPMSHTLANIDSVQFASTIAEYYSLRAEYFEKLEKYFVYTNEWYDYGYADSVYVNSLKEEEWLSFCRKNQLVDLSNSTRKLYYRKAKSIIYKIYASGLFPDSYKKELDTLVNKIRNYKLLITFSIENESNDSMAEEIENLIKKITSEDLTKGNYHYRVQHQIDLSDVTPSYKNKVDHLLNAQKMLEEASNTYPKDSVFVRRKSFVFTNLSWNYLFLKKFDKAEQCATNSLKIDSTDNNLTPRTNLGHSFLFRGQFSKAKAIYETLKGQEDEGNNYKDILLKDFADLKAKDITHKDMPRMKTEIEKW